MNPELEREVADLVAKSGITFNDDKIREILKTALALGIDGADRLNLKITASALAEMRSAFAMFAPYASVPKVTVFGSARTKPDDPSYLLTKQVARALADTGWMVATGAGPGIMQAAAEGAGREASIGVSIRLPFEERPNDVIHDDPKHVSMKYFFTRKLMLVKESKGFIAVPGGFGTLDETLELLTLQQTGKAEPTPIVLLDSPEGTFWQAFETFIQTEVAARGLVASDDLSRVLITSDPSLAVSEIIGFWRNYHSIRWVGKRLVMRLNHVPTPEQISQLNDRFSYCLSEGTIAATAPLKPEVSNNEHLELARLVMTWNPFKVGDLHHLVRAVNEFLPNGDNPPAP